MKLLRIVAVLLVLVGAVGYYVSRFTSNDHGRTAKSEPPRRTRNADDRSRSPSLEESSPGNPEEEPYRSRRATVLEVFDGDTLKVRFVESRDVRTIRIKGIDCPESRREVDKCWAHDDLIDIPCEQQVPLGKRATAYAKGLLTEETIELESYSGFKEGNHERILAYVRIPDGRDYGLEAVKKGYCKDSGVRYDHPRDDSYEKHRRGIRR